jgi:hypothetical protein
MQSIWNYFNCNQLHKNFLSLRDLVLYCGLSSTSDDRVQVDILLPAFHLLWPCSLLWRTLRKSSWIYRGQCGIIPVWQVLQNIASVLVAVFIWECSRIIRNIISVPLYNLTVTLLDWMQQRAISSVAEHLHFASLVTGLVYYSVRGIFLLSLANRKYDLCSEETWLLNKQRKFFMWPMKVCLPWLISYRCHTQLYARIWRYLSSYSKLVDVCLWILFMWFQNLKVSCMVVFRDEGTFEPTTEMLSRESKTNPLIWESCEFTLLGIFCSNVTERIYIQPFGILLTEKHTEIEHVFRPAPFLYCTQH